MKGKLKELYQSVILQHNKVPYHYEKKTDAVQQIEAYNPLCGDRFDIYIEMEQEQIKQIYFHGFGCAISKAATSVLAKHLENKSISEALALCATYHEITNPESVTTKNIVIEEELEAFEAAKHFPGRITCATLSWEAVEDFLKKLER